MTSPSAGTTGYTPGGRPHASWRRIGSLLFAQLLLAVGGCSEQISTEYGSRSGESVNGTAVLAEMFEQAGHQVSSTSWLSPRLNERADVIVWFPNDFQPPSTKVRDWLQGWLAAEPGRTLIYVGRDFDAAPGYWKAIRIGAPAVELSEINARLDEAQKQFERDRSGLPGAKRCQWFTMNSKLPSRSVRFLKGDLKWLSGVDPTKVEIELNSQLKPPRDADVLVASSNETLVSRLEEYDSQVLLVVNGSFLLNLPLINHEHRKLAERLIDEVGATRRVVFLESGPTGPPIYEEDPSLSRSGLAIFTIPPFDTVLLHLSVLGLVFCFLRLPIFGRPRELESIHPSDFGKHVKALGRLLAATRDRAFAISRLLQYQKGLSGETARHGSVRKPVAKPSPAPAAESPVEPSSQPPASAAPYES